MKNDKKGKFEPIISKISSLGTGAGIVEVVKPGGLVALGTTLDPYLVKSDSLIGSLVRDRFPSKSKQFI